MTITLRNTKGSALTYSEVDGNFEHLRDNKADTTHVHDPANINQAGATDGQVLVWNATTSQWEPGGAASGAGITEDEAIMYAIALG